MRNKGIFFVKRENDGIPEIDEEVESSSSFDILDHVTCGDIHPNVLGSLQLHSFNLNEVVFCSV